MSVGEKDLIITGGFNVYPAEVEAAIDAVPGVAESAVIGVAHPDFGEGVTAVVAAKANGHLEEENILSVLAGELAPPTSSRSGSLLSRHYRETAWARSKKNELRERYKDVYCNS